MNDLRDLDLYDITRIATDLGLAKFKAKEIFKAVHQQLKTITQITTLSLEERSALVNEYTVNRLEADKVSRGKKARKVSFKLEDGHKIEAVLMTYEGGRKTICISCQAGCPVGCLFCATGQMGFVRNLTVAEILGQVYYFAKDDKISNVVFMGMGEPFLNFDNVLKAARILNHHLGQNIGARKITISTIGIVPGIKKFSQVEEQFRLAWSLVAPFDQDRRKLVPLKGLPSIEQTIKAFEQYQKATQRRITIEYVVLAGVNDRDQDIEALIRIAKSLDSHVNLIAYNPTPKMPYKPGRIKQLEQELTRAGVNATIRQSLGQDIMAACGQLAGK